MNPERGHLILSRTHNCRMSVADGTRRVGTKRNRRREYAHKLRVHERCADRAQSLAKIVTDLARPPYRRHAAVLVACTLLFLGIALDVFAPPGEGTEPEYGSAQPWVPIF